MIILHFRFITIVSRWIYVMQNLSSHKSGISVVMILTSPNSESQAK